MSIVYANWQLSKAEVAAQKAANAREGMASKSHNARLKRWCDAVSGMASGEIVVGSRNPIRSGREGALPAFLAPEVLEGGFTSGRLVAGGPLLHFEQILSDETVLDPLTEAYVRGTDAMAADADSEQESNEVRRIRLNMSWLSQYGIESLQSLLKSRKYRVESAEESALLVIAWLVSRGKEEEATDLVFTLLPYFHLVRFYPRPASFPCEFGLKCSRRTVGEVRDEIEGRSEGVVNNGAMKYGINKLVVEKLAPAYDALVSLIMSTCTHVPGNTSLSSDSSDFLLPFQKSPTSAQRRAFQAVDAKFEEIASEAAELRRGRDVRSKTLKQLGPKRNCGFLLSAARTFFGRGPRLPTDKMEHARKILVQIDTNPRRGLPLTWKPGVSLKDLLTEAGAEQDCTQSSADEIRSVMLAKFRAEQRFYVRVDPSFLSKPWADLLMERIDALRADRFSGLDDVEPLLVACRKKEASRSGLREGAAVPSGTLRLLRLLQRGTVDELLAAGLVPSMETLADLAGPLIGAAKVQGVHRNEAFRTLYGATSAAFRKRRSLLLLNYETQVKFLELPWAEHLESFSRNKNFADRTDTLRELFCSYVRVCVRRWPHVMIPNKMVSALGDIAAAAKIKTQHGEWMGLMAELAADIFMGGFVPKWGAHAAVSKKMLTGSLYDQYFRVSVEDSSIWERVQAGKAADNVTEMEAFCLPARKGVAWSVASNGAYIERAMVFTTHNYAYLFEVLASLDRAFAQDELQEIAEACFASLSETLRPVTKDAKMPWQSKLQRTKNVAYGWRQLVFIVSRLDKSGIDAFFAKTVSQEKAMQGCHLQRALVDLRSVWQGMTEDRKRTWKPFFGWNVKGTHPIWSSNWCDRLQKSPPRSPKRNIDGTVLPLT